MSIHTPAADPPAVAARSVSRRPVGHRPAPRRWSQVERGRPRDFEAGRVRRSAPAYQDVPGRIGVDSLYWGWLQPSGPIATKPSAAFAQARPASTARSVGSCVAMQPSTAPSSGRAGPANRRPPDRSLESPARAQAAAPEGPDGRGRSPLIHAPDRSPTRPDEGRRWCRGGGGRPGRGGSAARGERRSAMGGTGCRTALRRSASGRRRGARRRTPDHAVAGRQGPDRRPATVSSPIPSRLPCLPAASRRVHRARRRAGLRVGHERRAGPGALDTVRPTGPSIAGRG